MKEILKNVGLVIIGVATFYIITLGLTTLNCLGEPKGQMVVLGGTSFRCR